LHACPWRFNAHYHELVVRSLPAPSPDLEFDYQHPSEDAKDNERIQESLGDGNVAFLIVSPYCTHRCIIVNEMLNGMHADIYNAVPNSGSEQDQRLRNAFGRNWGDYHDKLKEDVDAMKKAQIKVGNNNGKKSDDERAQGSPFVAHVDREQSAEKEHGRMWLGSKWHDEEYGRANRAGTMLHEISHAVLQTGDNTWEKDGKVEYISKEEANTRLDKLGAAAHKESFKEGTGCTSSKIDHINHRFSNSFVIFRLWNRQGTTAWWKTS
jgi:hypothetical protein